MQDAALRKRIEIAVGRTGRPVSQIAKELKLNRSAIYQWLDGTTEPAPRNLFLLARKARIRPEWLLFGEEPMESSDVLIAVSEIAQALEGTPPEKLRAIIREVVAFAKFKISA